MKIKADLHVHSENSFDGYMDIEDIVYYAKERGLDAVAICDHDKTFTRGGVIDGVTVINGVEFSTEYGHLLGLFINKKIKRADFFGTVKRIHDAGGIAVMAHPFQRKRFIDRLDSIAPYLDGVEVVNSRADRKNARANEQAYEFAKKHSLLMFAGSDAHRPQEVGNSYLEIECDGDIKQAILSGKRTAHGKSSKEIYVAQSQLVKLNKRKAHNMSYLKWLAFSVKCILNDIKKERKNVTYSQDW